MNQYREWILRTVPEQCSGMCERYSREMVEAFPELELCKGTVQIIGPWGSEHTTSHWWCETSHGQQVDPTELQFRKILSYRKIDGEIVGKCMNCGEYLVAGGYSRNFCSSVCGEAILRD